MPVDPPATRSDHPATRTPSSAVVEDVRSRLIDAAERLVALYGDDGTSSRAIIAAAGQRHNSAITYHFASRRGLLDAVWERRSAVVNLRRLELIAEWTGRPPRLRELVEAWIRPLAEFVDQGRPSYWARFNEDELRRYPLAMLPMLRPNLAGRPQAEWLLVLVRLFEQISQQIGGGFEGTIRVSSAIRMVISALAAWERDADAGRQQLSAVELGLLLEDFALALLRRPDETFSAPG